MWFCKNNSTIPLLFFGLYLSKMIAYQWTEEFASVWILFYYCGAFVLGVFIFILLSLLYFIPISQRMPWVKHSESEEDGGNDSFGTVFRRSRGTWYHRMFAQSTRRYLYFGQGYKLRLSRSVAHMNDAIVQKALTQIRINTSVFELMTVFMFVGLSLFSDYAVFEVPAAMSIVLLITLVFMLYSMLETWFRMWTPILFVLFVFTMNFLSQRSTHFAYKNYAYGLNYDPATRPIYSIETIEEHAQGNNNIDQSHLNYVRILENWKRQTLHNKPKLVIVNSSGGGLRSALWTFNVLQKIDQEFNGQFKRHIHLYTGASGGMIGAGYFRELTLKATKNEIQSIYSAEYYDKLGSDMLNKLAFSVSTRDVLLRLQNFQYGGYTYPKDRGQAFEEQLHHNTDHLMDHPLGYYEEFEKTAQIPMMIVTPSIVNDGRRLLLSSQSLGFLTANPSSISGYSKTNENIDYQSFFKNVDPQNIRFSSVLRASATFPFVSPMVTLPTQPEVQLMDAGIRDNYGGKITVELLFALQDWIKENTSGVVVLQIRDTKKTLDNTTYKQISLIDKFTLPFANIYSNYPKTQDFDQEQLLKLATHQLPYSVEIIQFNLREHVDDQISLSWHMSTQEKNKIQRAFYSPLNQRSLRELKAMMMKK